jgi:hypothetical protein
LTFLLAIHFLCSIFYAGFQIIIFKSSIDEKLEDVDPLYGATLFGILIGMALTWEIQLFCQAIGVMLSEKTNV